MNRLYSKLLSILLLGCILFSAVPASADYRTLTVGDRGQDVVNLKKRLYELGYFTTASFGEDYTKNTAEKVRRFISKYGQEKGLDIYRHIKKLL